MGDLWKYYSEYGGTGVGNWSASGVNVLNFC